MTISLLHPEALWIQDDDDATTYFGGDQEWFQRGRSRLDGCGPTSAATMTAYLARTRPALKALCDCADDMRRTRFAAHMEALYTYVTPGNMGLNRVEMFTDGMAAYLKSRNIELTAHVFQAYGNLRKRRAPVEDIAAFVKAGLASDCPIAFLNLTRGSVHNIQSWHWITLVSAEIDENRLDVCASDEGELVCFDLRLWYLSTHMQGALVYYTQA